MKYLIAVLAAAMLAGGSWGVAYAQEQEPTGCETVESRLAEVQALLDVRTGELEENRGLLENAVPSAQPYFEGLVAQLEDSVAKLAADVDVLEQERTECQAPEPTPTPTPEPNDPVIEPCPAGQIKITAGNGDVMCVEEVGPDPAPSTGNDAADDPSDTGNDVDNDVLNPSQFTDVPNTSRGVDTGGL